MSWGGNTHCTAATMTLMCHFLGKLFWERKETHHHHQKFLWIEWSWGSLTRKIETTLWWSLRNRVKRIFKRNQTMKREMLEKVDSFSCLLHRLLHPSNFLFHSSNEESLLLSTSSLHLHHQTPSHDDPFWWGETSLSRWENQLPDYGRLCVFLWESCLFCLGEEEWKKAWGHGRTKEREHIQEWKGQTRRTIPFFIPSHSHFLAWWRATQHNRKIF